MLYNFKFDFGNGFYSTLWHLHYGTKSSTHTTYNLLVQCFIIAFSVVRNKSYFISGLKFCGIFHTFGLGWLARMLFVDIINSIRSEHPNYFFIENQGTELRYILPSSFVLSIVLMRMWWKFAVRRGRYEGVFYELLFNTVFVMDWRQLSIFYAISPLARGVPDVI